MATWYSVGDDLAQQRLLDAWKDAPLENLDLCALVLETARGDVIAYADDLYQPDEHEPGNVPARFVLAQLQQVKNLWRAGTADENGNEGTEGYSFVPRPLDKTIQKMIRPRHGGLHVL